MALTVTHATVATDPNGPRLDHDDWNANHTVTGYVARGYDFRARLPEDQYGISNVVHGNTGAASGVTTTTTNAHFSALYNPVEREIDTASLG